jgi:hypothetical protein
MLPISCGVISEHAVRTGGVVPEALWVIAGAAPACASIVAVSPNALIAANIVVLLSRFAAKRFDGIEP